MLLFTFKTYRSTCFDLIAKKVLQDSIYFKLGRKLNIETKEEKMKFDLTVYVSICFVCYCLSLDKTRWLLYFDLNATLQKSLDDITK